MLSESAETTTEAETGAEQKQPPNRELRLTATTVQQLRDALLQEDGNERIAFGYCTRSGDDYLLHEVSVLEDTEHAVSESTACRADEAVERSHVSTAAETDRDLFIIHSHPFTDEAAFSLTDDDMLARFRNWLQPLFPETHLLFGVLGRHNLRVQRLTADGTYTALPVNVLGNWTLNPPLPDDAPAAADVDWEKHDRSIRALGLDGQQRLADTHVAVVGCGGIGSHLVTGLARLGVDALTLVDPDEVETSNLPRLSGAQHGDVGRAKTAVMQQLAVLANPDLETHIIADKVQNAEDHLKKVDLVVAGLDRLLPRSWLNEFCTRHLIPYIDAGTVISIDDVEHVTAEETFVQTVIPGVTGCFDCLNRLDNERLRLETRDEQEQLEMLDEGYIEGTDLTPAAAVLPLNLTAVAATLNTVVDVVTERRPPVDFLRVDQVTNEHVPISTQRSPSCVACGDNGVLAAGETVDAEAALPDKPLEPLFDRDAADVTGAEPLFATEDEGQGL